MQHWSPALAIAVAILFAGGSGQSGTEYRFRQGNRSGTVWVMGDDARLESDPEEGAAGRGRVVISKAGGKQQLLLNTTDHTYFDQVAYLSSKGVAQASLGTLNVREPFIVADVSKIRVDLLPSPEQEPSSSGGAAGCRPVSLKLSYELKLRLKMADVSIPGHVEGSGEYCLADVLPIARLPFGHGLEIVSGIPKVDVVLAERLASLKGVPLRQTLTVKRQIENGEQVSATSTLVLSDFRAVEISADRFDVPRDYRYQEPLIMAPTRPDR
jgi:hypothetical protein